MTIADNTASTVPEGIERSDTTEVLPVKARAKTTLVATISLGSELVKAALGGAIAGLGAFTGALTVTTASDTTSLKAAGIASGFTALVFFTNSLQSWYSQQHVGS